MTTWTPQADAWIRRRREFVSAALRLNEAWASLSAEDQATAAIGYPIALSLDELTLRLLDWSDATDPEGAR